MNAACTFSNTVSFGKMLVRWNERPMPIRQMRCGAAPVMSRSLSTIRPASGLRWPVIRLKKVDLPAPLGPITAAISRRLMAKSTRSTAVKPSKALLRACTSSIALHHLGLAGRRSRRAGARPQALEDGADGTGNAAGKYEQQDDEHRAHRQRPILGIGGDLLIEHDKGRRPHRRSPEAAHAAEDRHDQRLRRLGPEGEIRKHAAIEDAEQAARDAGEGPGYHEGGELIGANVDPDELGAFGVVADHGQHPAKR